MSEPIEMPGHGIAPEGGNTIGRSPAGGDSSSSESGGGTDTNSGEFVNLTNVLYVDSETLAELHNGNIERAYESLQDAIDAAGIAYTLELAPVSYPAVTVAVGQNGILFRGMGNAHTAGRPTVSGITHTDVSIILESVNIVGPLNGGSAFARGASFSDTIDLAGTFETVDGASSDDITVGGDARIESHIFSGGNVTITGDLAIDCASLNSLRSAGGTLEVGGSFTVIDAPTVSSGIQDINGDNEVVTVSVAHPLAKVDDTFAAAWSSQFEPPAGAMIGAPYCAVDGTVICPVLCLAPTAATVELLVTVFPTAVPAAP